VFFQLFFFFVDNHRVSIIVPLHTQSGLLFKMDF